MTTTIAPPPNTATAAGTAHARAALPDARHMRAEYLVAVASGLLTPLDVVEAAGTESGKPLRKISLRQLHLSTDGWGETRTRRLLTGLLERLGEKAASTSDLNLAWLLDPRVEGRRFMAWLDTQQPKTAAPWPDFPFASRKQVQA